MNLRDGIFKNKLAFLLVFLLLDILILLLHNYFPEKLFFNLDVESNLPTIYQGLKIFLLSFFSFTLFLFTKGNLKYFWLFFVMSFFFLALDEVGQIHENIPTYWNELFVKDGRSDLQSVVGEFGYESATWLPYYIIPFIGFFIVVVISLMKFLKECRKRAIPLIIGLLFLIVGIVFEYINTKPDIMFKDGYEILMFWEEAFEIFAITFILFFTYTFFVDRVRNVKYAILKHEVSSKNTKQNQKS